MELVLYVLVLVNSGEIQMDALVLLQTGRAEY